MPESTLLGKGQIIIPMGICKQLISIAETASNL